MLHRTTTSDSLSSKKDMGKNDLLTDMGDAESEVLADAAVQTPHQGNHAHAQDAGTVADAAAIATATLTKEHPEIAAHLKSGMRKLDWIVVPPLLLMWLANFIDRSNAGNARIAGMETDLGLKKLEFNTGLAIFYVPYIFVELPSNIILKKVGGNIWLPAITAAWGVATACMAATQNYGGFLAVRFVLGACEGGLLGGITLYLSTLYPRFAMQQRIARFYAAAAIAGSFGGLLASGLTTITTGGITGWRWLFIVEGVITIGFSIFSVLLMPRSVAKARWLDDDERHACLMALKTDAGPGAYTYRVLDAQEAGREKPNPHQPSPTFADQRPLEQGQADDDDGEKFEWYEIRRGVFNVQTWLMGIAYLCICNSLYSITLFLPSILSGLFVGSSSVQIQLYSVPPYVPAGFFVLVVAYFSDRWKMRGPFILAILPISILGYIILIATKNNDARYVAVFLVCLGLYPIIPCVITVIANNSASHYKRAAATAFQLMLANLGGFVATFIYDRERFGANGYIVPHSIVLASLCLSWICTALNVLYCYRENAARAAGKRDGNVARYEELVRQGITRAPIGDRHPAFRFSL